MPINIYKEENFESLEWLCDGIWGLSNQIDALETWLKENGKNLKPSQYVADIGFDIRSDASGGGAVLSSKAMKIMGEIGMSVFLSEYPNSISE